MTRIILVTLACAFFLQSCCNWCKRPPCPDCPSSCVEDCIGFEPLKARAVEINGSWKLTYNNMWLLDFGSSQSEAETALKIVQHYKMNKQCFVGRPDASLEYYLVNDQSPVGAFSGEDCLSFNPATIEVKEISGSYRIIDGNHSMLDFGTKKDEATCAFKLIKKYGFTSICYVGRPDPSMIYFRK